MKLSPKKLQILTLLAKGFTDKEIALKLKISKRTVETHITSIVASLQARNRVNAVAIYMSKTKKTVIEASMRTKKGVDELYSRNCVGV